MSIRAIELLLAFRFCSYMAKVKLGMATFGLWQSCRKETLSLSNVVLLLSTNLTNVFLHMYRKSCGFICIGHIFIEQILWTLALNRLLFTGNIPTQWTLNIWKCECSSSSWIYTDLTFTGVCKLPMTIKSALSVFVGAGQISSCRNGWWRKLRPDKLLRKGALMKTIIPIYYAEKCTTLLIITNFVPVTKIVMTDNE